MLRFLRSSPYYCCPNDRSRLVDNRCPTCKTTFSVTDGVLLLDTVQRSDRAAFDEQAASVSVLDEKQKAGGIEKADSVIHYAKPNLFGASILELGCGMGDLTHGLCTRFTRSDIYAVDHSVLSLKAMLRSLPTSDNRVHASTQDASRLCFPEKSLDLVIGFAILHHILDWKSLLNSVFGIIKPGGTMVFVEPFWDGYFWVATLLAIAVENLKLSEADLQHPEFGMCRFILDDIAFRTTNRDNPEVLNTLVDKHLFRNSAVVNACRDIGFRSVLLHDYFKPEFYPTFMDWFLSEYRITDAALIEAARRNFEVLKRMNGSALADTVSAFKYIVAKKEN
jgi:SAM-dependent methyltransferase